MVNLALKSTVTKEIGNFIEKILRITRQTQDCFVTDLPRQFEKLGRIFLGESINEPQLVDGF